MAYDQQLADRVTEALTRRAVAFEAEQWLDSAHAHH